MVSNVNPTDPKFTEGDDLDTEGHRRYSSVSPTEQDTAGVRNAPADEEDDTEGHRVFLADAPADEDDDTEGHGKKF